MKEIDKILDDTEKIMWEGNPQFGPYVLSVIPFVILGAPFLFVGINQILFMMEGGSPWWLGLLFPHLLFGVFMVLLTPIYYILVHKHTHYSITDKRIILQGGLIGRDFSTVDFDQISDSYVDVGLMDKLFGKNSGTIMFSSGGGSSSSAQTHKMSSITDPYEVFKFLKLTLHDIKTDIHYPNALRPNHNPGYRSEYTPSDK